MQSLFARALLLTVFISAAPLSLGADESWRALPATNGTVAISAQEWPFHPDPRTVAVTVHDPGGRLDRVKDRTGLMLSLHNWGGTGCIGTANPLQLAERFNVICLCVDYLQSCSKALIMDPEP